MSARRPAGRIAAGPARRVDSRSAAVTGVLGAAERPEGSQRAPAVTGVLDAPERPEGSQRAVAVTGVLGAPERPEGSQRAAAVAGVLGAPAGGARSRRGAVIAVLGAVLLLPGVARAEPRSSAEVRALATQAAAGDEAALTALRSTDVIDGRPADLDAALAGARAQELRQRLRALARPVAATGSPPAAAGARGAARDILREGRFSQAGDDGDRKTFGDRVRDWIHDRFDALDDLVPGPSGVLVALLGLGVLVIAAVLTSRVTARLQLAPETRLAGTRGRAADPAALERDAAAAEAAGDFAAAVRLRFAAGLLRLDQADAIRLRPSLTTGQVGRTLASPRFDALAVTFDQVAYGGRPAQPADAEAARDTWPHVLEDAT